MASSKTIVQLDASMNQRRRHMQQAEGQKTDKHRVEHAERGEGEKERRIKTIDKTDWKAGRLTCKQTDGRTDRRTEGDSPVSC